jgi:hypothetical protein
MTNERNETLVELDGGFGGIYIKLESSALK